MTPDRVNEICRPYSIELVPVYSPYGACSILYRAYSRSYSHAFDVIEGTSEEELEEMAIAWSLENSFR
jgi:hypothetical protein